MTYLHEPTARIIADTIPEHYGRRLTTMEITLHRFVLAEFNTHRVFSRNSASSRAIPVETQLERCLNDPAWPLSWPAEQPGMQGGTELELHDLRDAQFLFHDVWESTLGRIDEYLEAHPEKSSRLHKSVINRLLEPFMWHTIIVSSTDWQNFFNQRCTPQAQPEIRATAELMQAAFEDSSPTMLTAGEFHAPFVGLNPDDHKLTPLEKLKVSAARCARVSYLTHDGQRSVEADLKLFEETLAKYGHWSPLEHVATPLDHGPYRSAGNFGEPWVQFRSLVEDYGGTMRATEYVLSTGTHPRVGMVFNDTK